MRKRILLFLLPVFLYSQECYVLFRKNGIDYNIKIPRGWTRVCNNNKLYLYSDKTVDYSVMDEMCMCIKNKKDKIDSRAIGSVLKEKF